MNINTLVDRFLTWPLPEGTCADPCACNPTYPSRTGTNLLTADQARQMLEHVLQPARQQEPAFYTTEEGHQPVTPELRDDFYCVPLYTSPPTRLKPMTDSEADLKFDEWCISEDRHKNKHDDSDADNYMGMKIYVNDCMRQAWRAAISLAMKGSSS